MLPLLKYLIKRNSYLLLTYARELTKKYINMHSFIIYSVSHKISLQDLCNNKSLVAKPL